MNPFHLQHMPLLADDLPTSRVPRPVRAAGPRTPAPGPAPGALQPAASLALVLAGGAFMAVLAIPAYIAALRAARAHPDIRATMAAALAADE